MNIKDIPVPSVYKEESADFRFFLKWFDYALTKTQYDITNIPFMLNQHLQTVNGHAILIILPISLQDSNKSLLYVYD